MNASDIITIAVFNYRLSFTIRRYGVRIPFKEWWKYREKVRWLGKGRVSLDFPGRYAFVFERWEN